MGTVANQGRSGPLVPECGLLRQRQGFEATMRPGVDIHPRVSSVGTLGSADPRAVTVSADAVHAAARREGRTKKPGGRPLDASRVGGAITRATKRCTGQNAGEQTSKGTASHLTLFRAAGAATAA